MKHAFSFLPGPNPDHMALDYAVELSGEDVRALTPAGKKLVFNLRDLQVPKFMLDRNLQKVDAHPDKLIEIYDQDPWNLAKDFPNVYFHVYSLREAYIFARRIMHHLEDVLIMQMPLTPFGGFVQTFDVRIDVPKEVANFESFRRSLLVRPR